MNKNSPSQQKSKMELALSIIAIAVSIAAAAISIISIYSSDRAHDEIMEYNKKVMEYNQSVQNIQSYLEPLSYKISLTQTYSVPEIELTPEGTTINNIEFLISPYSGGINRVFTILYFDGKTYNIHETNLSEKYSRKEEEGSEVIYHIGLSSLPVNSKTIAKEDDQEKALSYTTSFYVLVEGYQHDYELSLVIIEFGVDDSGKFSGQNEIRVYSPEYLLQLNDEEILGEIPESDYMLFQDYENLLNKIKEMKE